LDPKPTLFPSSIKIFGYNADKPLPICGTFLATASADGNQTETTFYVIPGKSGSLFSKSTAEELDLLRVGLHSSNINTATVQDPETPTTTKDIINQYSDVFHGTDLLKDSQLQLHNDRNIAPVPQPICRVPFHTRRKVETELERLLNLVIIELVSGPTSWLSQFVPVPKADRSICICLDTRKLSKERYKLLQRWKRYRTYTTLSFSPKLISEKVTTS